MASVPDCKFNVLHTLPTISHKHSLPCSPYTRTDKVWCSSCKQHRLKAHQCDEYCNILISSGPPQSPSSYVQSALFGSTQANSSIKSMTIAEPWLTDDVLLRSGNLRGGIRDTPAARPAVLEESSFVSKIFLPPSHRSWIVHSLRTASPPVLQLAVSNPFLLAFYPQV